MMSDRRVEPVVTEALSWVTHSFLLLIDYCVARIIFDYCVARIIFDDCARVIFVQGPSLTIVSPEESEVTTTTGVSVSQRCDRLNIFRFKVILFRTILPALVKRLGGQSANQVRASPLWTRRTLLRCWTSWTARRRDGRQGQKAPIQLG